MLLFVYGTLKRGCRLHYYLEGADFIDVGETVDEYSLYDDGIPFVYLGKPVSRIRGEVYDIDEGILARLDFLEGGYERKIIPVKLADGGNVVHCFIYVTAEELDEYKIVPGGEDVLTRRR